jgi:APA family basic amino acid/polyamine antiporter
VAIMTGLLPIGALLQMTNIGTLFAFVVVCTAVLIMRRTNPDAERPFRCPLVPLVPILGIAFCLLLMFSLPTANWIRLIGWLLIGLVIYFLYSRHHTVMARHLAHEVAAHGVSPQGQAVGDPDAPADSPARPADPKVK